MDTVKAHYDKDTFRMHRFLIDEGQIVAGSLYISKELKGQDIPTEVLVQLEERDKGQERQGDREEV